MAAPTGRTAVPGARSSVLRSPDDLAPRAQGATARAAAPEIPVVLGARSRFEGLLAVTGDARVDGALVGDVVCRGALHVGEEGRIDGTVEAEEVVVLGRLRGDAIAARRIALGPGAEVVGVLRAPRVSLSDGCVLRGRCEMPTSETPPAAAGAGRGGGAVDPRG